MPAIRCVIIGDGPEREPLKALSMELGLSENVCFRGRIESDAEVLSWVKASRLFVLPSTREGFGIVVLEANACGVPVLVVDDVNNAARLLIREGENGYLCRLDAQDMGARILQALKSVKAGQFEACRAAASSYSWHQASLLVENAYRACLQEGEPDGEPYPYAPGTGSWQRL